LARPRFDLASGCTFDLWADDVPTCPVELRGSRLASVGDLIDRGIAGADFNQGDGNEPDRQAATQY
jgi:hypothetical protein